MDANQQKSIVEMWNGYTPEKRDQLAADYRGIIRRILAIAQNYDGKEEDYEFLMNNLRSLEKWLQEVFREQLGQRLNTNEEIAVADMCGLTEPIAIRDILTEAAESFQKKVLDTLDGPAKFDALLTKLGIKVVRVSNVILPPGEGTIKKRIEGRTDDQVAQIEVRLQQRLAELLILLERNGIFTGDIVVIPGKLTRDMVRSETYAIVEIPRINREVLVCDEVGEATLVIRGIFNRNTLQTSKKDELQRNYPDEVVRIVRNNLEQWQRDIIRALFTNEVDNPQGTNTPSPPRPMNGSIDLNQREAIITGVHLKYPTSTDWMALFLQKGEILPGIGIVRLGTIFKITPDPQGYKKSFVRLGMMLYGDDDLLLRKELNDIERIERLESDDVAVRVAAIEILFADIRKKYPTGKEWMSLWKYNYKGGYLVPGVGIMKMKKILEIEGNPDVQKYAFVKIGRIIYGEDDITLKPIYEQLESEQKLEKGDLQEFQKLQAKIKTEWPESKEWLKHYRDTGEVIAGMTFIRIVVLCGIGPAKTIAGKKEPAIQAGLKIYGAEDQFLNAQLAKLQRTKNLRQGDSIARDTLKAQILKKHRNVRRWFKLFQKTGDIVPGYAMTSILRFFGFNSPGAFGQKRVFFQLTESIYGPSKALQDAVYHYERTERLEKHDPEEMEKLKAEIKNIYPTSTEWYNLWQRKSRTGKIASGYAMEKLGKFWQIPRNPADNKVAFIELGMAIYGSEDMYLKAQLAQLKKR